MRKVFTLLILTVLIFSCKSKLNCFDKAEYNLKNGTELIEIAEKTYFSQEQITAEAAKDGIAMDFFPPKVYFNKNCTGQQGLDPIEPIIGALLSKKNLKIKLTGNAESYELESNPNISLERAKFVADILKLNGIDKDRIVIFDAKSNRPNGAGIQKENRRVDLDIFID